MIVCRRHGLSENVPVLSPAVPGRSEPLPRLCPTERRRISSTGSNASKCSLVLDLRREIGRRMFGSSRACRASFSASTWSLLVQPRGSNREN